MSKFHIHSIVGTTITYYHPKHGAIAMHINDQPPQEPPPLPVCSGCGNEYDPEVCWCGDEVKMHHMGSGHSPVPTGCTCGYNEQPKKSLDISPSLGQNTIMCDRNVRFVTAVLLTVNDLRQKGTAFSVYNVTTALREQANAGELTLVDKSQEDVNGTTTYRIEHNEVREVFRELLGHDLIKGLKATLNSVGGYMEYVDAAPTLVKFDGIAPSGVCKNDTTISGDNVTISTAPPQPPALTTLVKALVQTNSVQEKIRDYLKGRRGQPVSMKEIQSRFKNEHRTCKDYADVVANMGLPVNTLGDCPSKWTVAI